MTRVDFSDRETELLKRVDAEDAIAFVLRKIEAAALLEKADCREVTNEHSDRGT